MRSFDALTSLLRNRSIERVVLLDDEFNDSDVAVAQRLLKDDEAEVASFLEHLSRPVQVWLAVECGFSSPDELDSTSSQLLHRLAEWMAGDSERGQITNELQELCRAVGFRSGHDRAGLRQFKERLDELKLETLCLGLSDSDIDGLVDRVSRYDAQLIFVDYYFGKQDSEESVALSVELAKAIYSRYRSQQPVVVLMSSASPQAPEVDDYLTRAEVLAGSFYFVGKQELGCPIRVFSRLEGMVRSQPIAQSVGVLLSQLDSALDTVQREFRDCVFKLRPGDYWNLHWIALRTDGDPLGDYLGWLLGRYIESRLIGRHLAGALKSINQATEPHEGNSPILPESPSRELVRLFANAVFADVGDLAGHPHGVHERNVHWDARQGDLFVNKARSDSDARNVQLLMTPECDLARSRSRSGESAKAYRWRVLLLEGIATPIQYREAAKLSGSELLMLGEGGDEQLYRIEWSFKSPATLRFSDLQRDEWVRRKRLKMPFLSEVQQKFTSRLGRVGVPVMTPVVTALDATIMAFSDMPEQASPIKEKVLCRAAMFFSSREKTGVYLHIQGELKAELREFFVHCMEQSGAKAKTYRKWVSEDGWEDRWAQLGTVRRKSDGPNDLGVDGLVGWTEADERSGLVPHRGNFQVLVVFRESRE